MGDFKNIVESFCFTEQTREDALDLLHRHLDAHELDDKTVDDLSADEVVRELLGLVNYYFGLAHGTESDSSGPVSGADVEFARDLIQKATGGLVQKDKTPGEILKMAVVWMMYYKGVAEGRDEQELVEELVEEGHGGTR